MTDELMALLAAQDRVVSRRQALRAGLTKHAWDWRLGTGRWQGLLPGVAVAHSGDPTDTQCAWAAVLYAGEGAALGGRASLTMQGAALPWRGRGRAPLEVVVPQGRRVVDAALPDGRVVTMRRVTKPERWATTRRGLPVVRAEAAVLHACAWASSDQQAEWLLTATVQQRLTAVPVVRRTLVHLPELTRRALVRETLDDIELGAHALTERRFLGMCRKYRLPLPDELQRRVRAGSSTYYLDARYRLSRVTVEVDGAHHRDVESWEADALRSLRVVASLPGEQVLRITGGMLRHHEAEVARLLGSVLAGRAAA